MSYQPVHGMPPLTVIGRCTARGRASQEVRGLEPAGPREQCLQRCPFMGSALLASPSRPPSQELMIVQPRSSTAPQITRALTVTACRCLRTHRGSGGENELRVGQVWRQHRRDVRPAHSTVACGQGHAPGGGQGLGPACSSATAARGRAGGGASCRERECPQQDGASWLGCSGKRRRHSGSCCRGTYACLDAPPAWLVPVPPRFCSLRSSTDAHPARAA